MNRSLHCILTAKAIACFICFCLLLGCGQRGDLTLPEAHEEEESKAAQR